MRAASFNMCPGTLQVYIMAVAVAAIAVVVYVRLFAAIRENFGTFGALVNTPERKDAFTRSRIEGYYQNRKVTLTCPHFDKGARWIFSIEPRVIPVPQKRFLISYPRPTENTQWRGEAVYYSRPGIFYGRDDRVDRIYTDAEMRAILDELSAAAHCIESGSCA